MRNVEIQQRYSKSNPVIYLFVFKHFWHYTLCIINHSTFRKTSQCYIITVLVYTLCHASTSAHKLISHPINSRQSGAYLFTLAFVCVRTTRITFSFVLRTCSYIYSTPLDFSTFNRDDIPRPDQYY